MMTNTENSTRAILLLLSPMLPVIGEESGGGQLWLRLGPFSFQPGEIAEEPDHLANGQIRHNASHKGDADA